MIWDVLFYISLFTVVALIAILFIFKFRKNVYLANFERDELFEESNDPDIKNFIYSTKGETRKYIKRYVIRKTKYDKFVICNYNKCFNSISYFIVALNNKLRPIAVLQVSEKNTNTNSSKIFVVPSKTKFVNVIIKEADSQVVNDRIIQVLPKAKVTLYSVLSSTLLFNLLFVLRHLIAVIFGNVFSEYYFGHIYNYIAILICFAITLLYFVMTYRTLRKRNFKNSHGGKVGYEFF